MLVYYDYEGRPIEVLEWERLFNSPERPMIKTVVLNHTVSTVWLGIDYSFGTNLTGPMIFESMIFSPSALDSTCWRYHTRDEALIGHNELVEMVAILPATFKRKRE